MTSSSFRDLQRTRSSILQSEFWVTDFRFCTEALFTGTRTYLAAISAATRECRHSKDQTLNIFENIRQPVVLATTLVTVTHERLVIISGSPVQLRA